MNRLCPQAHVDPSSASEKFTLHLAEGSADGDRRLSPRFPVAAEVRFIRSNDERSEIITGEIHDASLKGMRAVLDQSVRRGELLRIDVRTEAHGQFQVEVQIMWVEVGVDGRFIAGCEFCTILTLKQRAQLQRLAEAATQTIRREAV